MNEQEQQRFHMLRAGACVTAEYVHGLYGLSWPLSSDVRPHYEAWAERLSRSAGCASGAASRYELEAFMQQKKVVPRKWMAAQLGMAEQSLGELLNRLDGLELRRARYVVYDDLIADTFSDDLVSNLPGLKYRTFGDHNSFCERLHVELKQTLDIDVKALFCATSERLEDDPKLYASDFDCLTFEPLSGKHQLWLDFRKPLYLGPDRCSKLYYVENRDVLRPYSSGTREPMDIEYYVQLVAGQQHG